MLRQPACRSPDIRKRFCHLPSRFSDIISLQKQNKSRAIREKSLKWLISGRRVFVSTLSLAGFDDEHTMTHRGMTRARSMGLLMLLISEGAPALIAVVNRFLVDLSKGRGAI